MSARKAACRIHHNECSLCSYLRQFLRFRLHRRFQLNGIARALNIPVAPGRK
jgi:hypothetical protein